jgi:group II intron reverse transcriptase/maturase
MAREMSPKLVKVMERAKNDPTVRHLSLAHLIDEEILKRVFHRQRKAAAVGVDGVTKEQYGAELDDNVHALHERLKAGQYRHQPIRRVHIPKGPRQTRPIGVSCIDDKLVQGALREVLEAVYEPTFYECSYGFRPRRGAHDALRTLNQTAMTGRMNWILEADIRSYFDSIVRTLLMEMLSQRVADTSLLRLVGKCLHVGVLDSGAYSEPDEGTAQGSSLSPLLGNIYLHNVLDVWFATDMVKRLRGKAQLIRYADDFLIGFECREDAEAVMGELVARMAQYGLQLHPDKTRIVPFRKPGRMQQSGKGPGTFDFLGFTAYWRRSRKGHWIFALKTRAQRLGRAIQAVQEYCRCHRHESVEEQRAGLNRRLNGHYNYFGVNGNARAMGRLDYQAGLIWHKWLSRRGQRAPMTWERFAQVLKAHPLARPSIRVQIWGPFP